MSKRSFILYTDQLGLFEKLPDDKAAELIRHIFRYVAGGDENHDDIVISIAFESIKNQLIRDGLKYENKVEQARQAGLKSAEARRAKRNNKQRKATESNEKQRNSTNVNQTQRTPTNSTVNVNVNVNDNDNVNVNEIKKGGVVFPFDSDAFMSEWKVWCAYRKEQGAKAYKPIGEQAALMKLSKLARNDTEAVEIIRQSIENGWKGFFEVEQKRKSNGKRVDLADIISGL